MGVKAMESVMICTHRLQPLHLGHVRFWREIRKRFSEHLIICILRNEFTEVPNDSGDANEFMALSASAFATGRTPLPNWERLRLAQLAVAADPLLQASTTVILRHRADLSWQRSIEDLPEKRTWIFNLTHEAAFDSAKVKFYTGKGENTVTVPVGRAEGLSGSTIRDALKLGTDYSFLPPACVEYFRQHCLSFFQNNN